MPSNADKLKQLKALRQISIDRIEDLNLVAHTTLENETLIDQLKARCSNLQSIYEDFEKQNQGILAMISTMEDGNIANENDVRKKFESSYYSVKEIYNKLFEDKAIATTESSAMKPSVKLPKLELVKFRGDPKEWRTFIDMFESTVHKNNNLSATDKFSYLIASLEGTPLSLVKHHRLCDQNYLIALNSLKVNYEDKRELASSYYNEIENAPKLNESNATPQNLRKLLNIFTENLSGLENMGFPVTHWDYPMFNKLIRCLDSDTVAQFEFEHDSEIPSFESLKKFLLKKGKALTRASDITSQFKTNINSENSKFKCSSHPRSNSYNASSRRPSSSFFVETRNSPQCPLCNLNHLIYKCPKFISYSPRERYNLAKIHKWCINCLGFKHSLNQCNSRSTCQKCRLKHHTLLHFDKVTPPVTHSTDVSSQNSPASSLSSPNCATSPHNSATTSQLTSLTNFVPSKRFVLLSTALIEVLDKWGNYRVVRALLDSGSQANFITQKCCNRLGLTKFDLSLSIQGLGQMASSSSKGVSLNFRALNNPNCNFVIDSFILPHICADMPKVELFVDSWSHIKNLTLADPKFNIPSSVDILLGADIFSSILLEGRLAGKIGHPVALNTGLGWLLMGSVNSPISSSAQALLCSCDVSLENSIKRFWELEELPTQNHISSDDQLCENIYSSTYSRSETGRFTVSLPFRSGDPCFSDTRSYAVRRFLFLEKKLCNDPSLYEKYCEFMHEYLRVGHMTLLEKFSIENNLSSSYYYIPHHCVIKPDNVTTKLRVVFDASSSSDGLSLNSTLLIGPKLQRDLVAILLNFRFYAVAFISDIKQMYRQILVNDSHKNFQRIVWRFSPNVPLQDYVLNTVTYGVSSAPFLAIRTLLQLAEEERHRFPLASQILRKNTYIDDIVSGANSLEDALKLKEDLVSLLRNGGFELHKWNSNNPLLLADNSYQSYPKSLDLDIESTVKVLGLQWNSSLDNFSFHVSPITSVCTKRSILSELARIFDPLGFLSPLTLFAKRLIQHLWTLGLNWDDSPPQDVIDIWSRFQEELPNISHLSVPRYIPLSQVNFFQIHGFSDASEKGYAATVYIRYSKDSQICTSLLYAKSKVSPLKTLSIPRLELCAAVLLADLLFYVIKLFETQAHFKMFAWTDSMVVLSWIRSSPHKWKPFVANRISRIHDKFSPTIWRFVPSQENPADCASRGMLPNKLLENSLWWAGPSFLTLSSDGWPGELLSQPSYSDSIEKEAKQLVFTATISPNFINTLLEKFSSLSKIQRIIAYILRFIHNCLKPSQKSFNWFTQYDLHEALFVIVKNVQRQVFSVEIAAIKASKPVSHFLRKLNPFIDDLGVLRVGGRLAQSNLSINEKYPALLPSSHKFTNLLIDSTHKQHLHPGVQTLHYLLCQNFWILSAKRVIRSVISHCQQCWKLNPSPLHPLMGSLPRLRVSQIKPFSCVGVDYGGPFHITMSKTRGAKTLKAYICLFVCFATKALHLELVSDLSTEAFVAALKRFIARRGRCNYIFSDCGTNFVGASKQLAKLMQEATTQEKLEWHFNPPSAPHFGGLWEAGIKSVKTHIFRVIGNQLLTYEELNTLLIQIEAILNSRPLCPISSDPNDLSALSPGHFLTMEPLTCLPEQNLVTLKLNRLDRWQLLQRLHQDFWTRWHKEYLHTLHQRGKWTKSSKNILVGAMVLLKSDLISPLRWQLGRIIDTHPGVDGTVRVVTVRTTQGTFKRPVAKVCPLPLDSLT